MAGWEGAGKQVGLTAQQLHAVVRSARVPWEEKRGDGARGVRAAVVGALAPATVLAMHHLTALGAAGRAVLGMDLV